MKITIKASRRIDKQFPSAESQYRKVTVEHPYDDLDIEGVFTQIIEPALLAWGFHPNTISRYLNDD